MQKRLPEERPVDYRASNIRYGKISYLILMKGKNTFFPREYWKPSVDGSLSATFTGIKLVYQTAIPYYYLILNSCKVKVLNKQSWLGIYNNHVMYSDAL